MLAQGCEFSSETRSIEVKIEHTNNRILTYPLTIRLHVGLFNNIYIHHHHHHHHVVPLARISLTLSRHFSLSFITSGRSSALHPISSDSCWAYVLAGHPTFARPYVGLHRSTSLMSSSLLLQQCTACLVRIHLSIYLSIYLSVSIYIPL